MNRKRYGESRIDKCPFCGKTATAKNSQGVPVCRNHKRKLLENMKCACGEWLDVNEGKWGPYFRCFNCGNISFRKGLEMNSANINKEKGEVTVRSDELDLI